jgi:uncharacterized membrane protein YeaQ/YmgE (transglycosylase-associated protein family)
VEHLAVQFVVATLCGYFASILIPRQIPGRFLGLVIVGLAGVWLGEGLFKLLKNQYGLNPVFLQWALWGVPIIPSVLGSVTILYLLTIVFRGGRYTG